MPEARRLPEDEEQAAAAQARESAAAAQARAVNLFVLYGDLSAYDRPGPVLPHKRAAPALPGDGAVAGHAAAYSQFLS